MGVKGDDAHECVRCMSVLHMMPSETFVTMLCRALEATSDAPSVRSGDDKQRGIDVAITPKTKSSRRHGEGANTQTVHVRWPHYVYRL